VDWPQARAILLITFAVVNGLLAYAIWGPSSAGSGTTGRSDPAQLQAVRDRLSELGLDLAVQIPQKPTPVPQFLRVQYEPTPDLPFIRYETSGGRLDSLIDPSRPRLDTTSAHLEPTVDRATGVVRYRPLGRGAAAREVRLENRSAVRQVVEEYLRAEGMFRQDARFSRFYPAGEGFLGLEYTQVFQGASVFSSYRRVVVSRSGIQTVEELWAKPLTFRGEQKAVLAPTEALLRVAGHAGGQARRSFTEIEFGYYAGSPLGGRGGSAYAEDLIPVWRIVLSTGEVFHINAFTGEVE
jgi:hypothetical protein